MEWLDWEEEKIIKGWIRVTRDGQRVLTVSRTGRNAKNRWKIVLTVFVDDKPVHFRHLIKDDVTLAAAQTIAMGFEAGPARQLVNA